MKEILNKKEIEMNEIVKAFHEHIKSLRSGRANADMLDRVVVDYYGSLTPLNQTASITVPEPQLIVIKPYDRSLIVKIVAGIDKANLKLNPVADAEVVRISIPPLTEEIRKDIVKSLKKELEEYKIRIRNSRRDGIEEAKKLENISEDLIRDFEKDIQKITDKFINKLEEVSKNKEKSVMSI